MGARKFTADPYAVYKWRSCKITADRYAVYKWSALKDPLIIRGGYFFGGPMIQEFGFYIIADKFFEDFPDPYLKGNKSENRPHYFAFQDNKTGLFWMIPLSSRVDKYRNIIQKRQQSNRPCDIYHIAKLDDDRTSVFLIGDMFPLTEEYILRPYTIRQNHLRLTSEAQIKQLFAKSRKVFTLLHKGIVFSPTAPKVLDIEQQLISRL